MSKNKSKMSKPNIKMIIKGGVVRTNTIPKSKMLVKETGTGSNAWLKA